jgi:hypothetical protein
VDIDDLLGTEDLATETGDAVLAELDHRKQPGRCQTGNAGCNGYRLHVNHIGGTDVIANAAARALLKLNVFDHPALRILRVSNRFPEARAIMTPQTSAGD